MNSFCAGSRLKRANLSPRRHTTSFLGNDGIPTVRETCPGITAPQQPDGAGRRHGGRPRFAGRGRHSPERARAHATELDYPWCPPHDLEARTRIGAGPQQPRGDHRNQHSKTCSPSATMSTYPLPVAVLPHCPSKPRREGGSTIDGIAWGTCSCPYFRLDGLCVLGNGGGLSSFAVIVRLMRELGNGVPSPVPSPSRSGAIVIVSTERQTPWFPP